MNDLCPYDGNRLRHRVTGFWRFWHCDACRNDWLLTGVPVGGKGKRLDLKGS